MFVDTSKQETRPTGILTQPAAGGENVRYRCAACRHVDRAKAMGGKTNNHTEAKSVYLSLWILRECMHRATHRHLPYFGCAGKSLYALSPAFGNFALCTETSLQSASVGWHRGIEIGFYRRCKTSEIEADLTASQVSKTCFSPKKYAYLDFLSKKETLSYTPIPSPRRHFE